MEVLFQDISGEIKFANGRICEKLLCIYTLGESDEPSIPLLFWLKFFKESLWHRFSIGGYRILLWCEYDEAIEEDKYDISGDLAEFREEGYAITEMGEKDGLKGRRILSVNMDEVNTNGVLYTRLTIRFAGDKEFILLSDGEFATVTVE